MTPRALVADLRCRFCDFPPEELASFSRADPCNEPIQIGDELDIVIRMAGKCRVRMTCCDDHSMTLATLKEHPEAGRITFGAYRHETGAVVFHIRSRSRSGNAKYSAGFLAFGEAMQTNTWTEFVRTVASTYGTGVIGEIHADTSHAELTEEDTRASQPTFQARGAD